MARYKFVLSYDGYDYFGFQQQPNLPTVEEALLKAFAKMGFEVKIFAAGRTDRHVSAIGQVFHLDLEQKIPPYGFVKGLNSLLPPDIRIESCEEVDKNFHSRFSAIKKEYRYYINTKAYNPLTYRRMPYIGGLNVDLMAKALKYFEGEHDFRSFASAQIDKRKSTVKTIYLASLSRYDNYLEFRFVGSGFLKYQIRRMLGIVVEIGKGNFDPTIVEKLLELKDPKATKYIVEGCGLYLYRVYYEEE